MSGCGSSACACRAPEPVAEMEGESGCSGGESFALQVLGDDMAPEFSNGHIVIIEPEGALREGRFVLVRDPEALGTDAWVLRQIDRQGGAWLLRQLNPRREWPLPDLAAVHGVVIQRAVPGRRKLSKFYL